MDIIAVIRFNECPIDHYDQIQFQNLFDPAKVLFRENLKNILKFLVETSQIVTFVQKVGRIFIIEYEISIPITAILLHSQSSPFIICKHF